MDEFVVSAGEKVRAVKAVSTSLIFRSAVSHRVFSSYQCHLNRQKKLQSRESISASRNSSYSWLENGLTNIKLLGQRVAVLQPLVRPQHGVVLRRHREVNEPLLFRYHKHTNAIM